MSSVDAATLNPSLAFKVWWQGVAVVGAWLAVALLISYWPNATRNWPMTQGLANLCVGIASLFIVLSLLGRKVAKLGQRLSPTLLSEPAETIFRYIMAVDAEGWLPRSIKQYSVLIGQIVVGDRSRCNGRISRN